LALFAPIRKGDRNEKRVVIEAESDGSTPLLAALRSVWLRGVRADALPLDDYRSVPHLLSTATGTPQEPLVPPRPQTDALRGSLDLLVLKTLSLAPMHGWGISQRVQQISDGVLEMNQGSLYPALQRLEKVGLITSDWDTTDNNRRARYYRLTAAGRRALGQELESWRRFAAGLEAVLRTS
jgi:PadR family transcriptional regulator PadR